MCGIAGTARLAGNAEPADHDVVHRMLEWQRHRGPDGVGIHAQGPVVLGHRRLSIIDLSQAASQPMSNEDGSIWITFNGEIYNYRELGAELRPAGHRFRSQSDTEILLHGYEEWGMAGLLGRLRGMFAFALYDANAHRAGKGEWLYLARDRVGIKPVYYAESHGTLRFASEVKALRRTMPASGMDLGAVTGFLCLGSVPAPRTYLEGIHCLPPGAFLAMGPAGTRVEQYWNLRYRAAGASAVQPILSDAVERHLLADVPVGIFLSGGLDSGALAAIVSRVRQEPALTLTVSFPEAEFNEGGEARQLAQTFGTNHIEIPVDDRVFLEEIPRILEAMDQPTADGVNTYFVSKAAHEAGLKVVLSGLGGDEVFFGYRHYRMLADATSLLWSFTSLPGMIRNGLVSAAKLYSARRNQDKWTRVGYISERPTDEGLYLLFRGFFGPAAVCELLGISEAELNRTLENEFAGIRMEGENAGWDINRIHYLEMKRYLHDQLLRDSDVFSMSHSLELRVPYLDHVLVEQCCGIAAREKLSDSVNKPLLLEAAGHPALDEVARRKKRGFTFPFAQWMRRHAGQLEEIALAEGPLDRTAVRRCWEQFRLGRLHWSRAWSTTVLAACFRTPDHIAASSNVEGLARC